MLDTHPLNPENSNRKIFALFPGQGSQHVGMAKDLYENFKIVREIFEEASDAISKDLKTLCFDGPNSDLILTENTQPCLLVASVAAFRVARSELDFNPVGFAGHSLGEYSALVAADSLSLYSATRWVHERGRAMQAAIPAGQGTMAAILGISSARLPGATEEELIAHLCEMASISARAKRAGANNLEGEGEITIEAVVEAANFNSPGQVVIAGSVDAVEEAIALVKGGVEFSGKAVPISVSAPFHCKLMRAARERMADLFSQATADEYPKPLLAPYVPNRTARLTTETSVIFELLIEQVDHPVLWKQSIAAILESGTHPFVEFGPGKVLSGLVKRIATPLGTTVSLSQMGDSSQLKALEALLRGPRVAESSLGVSTQIGTDSGRNFKLDTAQSP